MAEESAVERLIRLTNEAEEAPIALGRVVVPPHPSVRNGKTVMVDGYTYNRRGGPLRRLKEAVTRTVSPDDPELFGPRAAIVAAVKRVMPSARIFTGRGNNWDFTVGLNTRISIRREYLEPWYDADGNIRFPEVKYWTASEEHDGPGLSGGAFGKADDLEQALRNLELDMRRRRREGKKPSDI